MGSLSRYFFKNSSIRDFLGIGLSAFLLILLFRRVDFKSIRILLDPRDYSLFICSCSVFILSVFINAYRLKYLLKHSQHTTREIKTLNSVIIGNFFNNLLPGNIGELIKLKHLSVNNNFSLRFMFNIWVIDKIVATTIISILAVGIYISYTCFFSWGWILTIPAFTVVFFHTLFFFLTYSKLNLEKIINLLPLKWVRVYIRYHIQSISRFYIRRLKDGHMLLYYLTGILLLGLNIVNQLINLHIGGIPESMASIENAFLFTMLLMFIYFIPSAPSSIGVLQYATYTVLEQLAVLQGIPIDETIRKKFLISSFVFYFTSLIPELLLGLLVVCKEWKNLLKIRDSQTIS